MKRIPLIAGEYRKHETNTYNSAFEKEYQNISVTEKSSKSSGKKGWLFLNKQTEGANSPYSDGGSKRPLYHFFPVTSTNVEISPKNFLPFSFNPFATLA